MYEIEYTAQAIEDLKFFKKHDQQQTVNLKLTRPTKLLPALGFYGNSRAKALLPCRKCAVSIEQAPGYMLCLVQAAISLDFVFLLLSSALCLQFYD